MTVQNKTIKRNKKCYKLPHFLSLQGIQLTSCKANDHLHSKSSESKMIKVITVLALLAVVAVYGAPQLSDIELKEQAFNRINEAEYDYK